MAELVNPKILEKISKSKYDKKIKNFLIEAIREEFSNSEKARWNYTDFYKNLTIKHSK